MPLDKHPESLQAQITDDRVSLIHLVLFVRKSWKTIVIMGALGTLCAIIFLLITPAQYYAIAQIKVAQFGSLSASSTGSAIEEPSSLILRMQFPTNYDEATILACGYRNALGAADGLAKNLKFYIPKGMVGAVELRVASPSPEQAKNCATAVFKRVAYLQSEQAKPLLDEIKLKLERDDERIMQARRLIAKADQSGQVMSAAYLSARDEMIFFLGDREKQIDLIGALKERGTRLISPIYVSQQPTFPNKTFSLMMGCAAGVCLGVLIILIRKALYNLRKIMQEGEIQA